MDSFYHLDYDSWPVVRLRFLKSTPSDDEFESYLDVYRGLYSHGQKFSVLISGLVPDWGRLYQHARFNIENADVARQLTEKCALVLGTGQAGSLINQLLAMTNPPVPVTLFNSEQEAMTWLQQN